MTWVPEPDPRYWMAVLDNPKRENEGAFSYVVRIAELVAGEPVPVKRWPKARLPYREAE